VTTPCVSVYPAGHCSHPPSQLWIMGGDAMHPHGSSRKKRSLYFSIPLCEPPVSFVSFPAEDRTSSAMLKRSVQGTPLTSIFSGTFLVRHNWIWCKFQASLYMILTRLKSFSVSNLLIFYEQWIWNYDSVFPPSTDMVLICYFFLFNSVTMTDTWLDFWMLTDLVNFGQRPIILGI
jgi:hypothetical protein